MQENIIIIGDLSKTHQRSIGDRHALLEIDIPNQGPTCLIRDPSENQHDVPTRHAVLWWVSNQAFWSQWVSNQAFWSQWVSNQTCRSPMGLQLKLYFFVNSYLINFQWEPIENRICVAWKLMVCQNIRTHIFHLD